MEEEKKIGFFKRLKIAIFNVEDYKIFVKEKLSKAVKYAAILIVIITLIMSVVTTYTVRQKLDKIVSFVKNDFPDFQYENGTLSISKENENPANTVNAENATTSENQENTANAESTQNNADLNFFEAYDKENDARLIVDTSDNLSEEKINEYKEKAKESTYSLILLKDKAIYSIFAVNDESSFFSENKIDLTDVKYTDIMGSFGIDELTKTELFDKYFNDDGIMKITIVIFDYAIITLFMENILTVLEDALIIAIFGWIASKICKVNLSFSNNCSLAIYSVTLSLILSIIYAIVNTFTGFEIKYFSLMYMIIAYIYIIAAIMIIKSDPTIKNMQEIPVNEPKDEEKAIEVEKVEEKKKENKEKNKEDDKKEKSKDEKEKKKESDKKLGIPPEGEGA